MCGDFLFGTLMCCCLPYISKRDGHHATFQDHEEAPRPVKLQSKSRAHNATAINKPSLRRVSAKQAHRNLIASLSQPANGKQTATLFRLRTAFPMTEEHLRPEFFAPVFADLDTVLFGGCLRNRMLVDWANMPSISPRMVRGVSSPHRISISGIAKVRIRLNKAVFESDTKEDIWGTIVHEMLHAYLAVTSNWSVLTMRHHGPQFEESCKALVERLAFEGFEVHHVV
jgi:hypothetical protein